MELRRIKLKRARLKRMKSKRMGPQRMESTMSRASRKFVHTIEKLRIRK